MNNKVLVAYFSVTGNTAKVAQSMAEILDAPIYEIVPEAPYSDADLDWKDPNSRSTVEMKNRSSRPSIADANAPVEDADTILLGFPVWWHTAPHIVWSFLEQYDFSGKTIILFGTAGSETTVDTAVEDLKRRAPDAILKAGVSWTQTPDKETVTEFLKEQGLV